MKKENIVGIVGTILIIGLVAYFSFDYFNKNEPAVIKSDSTVTNQSSNTNTNEGILTATTVENHRVEDDCWLIISGNVYAVSSYLNSHPGGRDIIIPYCGQDATQAFSTQGGQGSHSSFASSELAAYVVGAIGSNITPEDIQQIEESIDLLPPPSNSKDGDEVEDEEDEEDD